MKMLQLQLALLAATTILVGRTVGQLVTLSSFDGSGNVMATNRCTLYFNDCDNYDRPMNTQGYSLSYVSGWTKITQISAVVFTYSDINGNSFTQKLGDNTGYGCCSGFWNTHNRAITRPVVKVQFRRNDGTNNELTGIKFFFDDGTDWTMGSWGATGQTTFESTMQLGFGGLNCYMRYTGDYTYRTYDCLAYSEQCSNKSFDPKTITDMTVRVALDTATQNIDLPILQVFGCGERVYTLTESHLFLTHDAGSSIYFMKDNMLTLQTNLPSDEGEYDITLSVYLKDYPSVTFSQVFKVTIICEVQTLTWNVNPPANHNIRWVLDESYDIDYSVTKWPVCVHNPTFTIESASAFTNDPNVLVNTVNTPTIDEGKVTISQLTKADVGAKSFILKATDTQVLSKTINLNIIDPCSSEITGIVPTTLENIIVTLPMTGTQFKDFTIITPIELANIGSGLYCNFVNNLNPVPLGPVKPWLTYDSVLRKYTVDETLVVLPNDLGEHRFRITIDSQEYSATVASINPEFIVEIQCFVTNWDWIEVPLDYTYTLNHGLYRSERFLRTQQEACKIPETVTYSFVHNGVAAAQPASIQYDAVNDLWLIDMLDQAEVGLWQITNTVTVVHPFTLQSTSQSSTFTLTVLDDCINTFLIDRDYTMMQAVIGSGFSSTQNLYAEDWIQNNRTDLGHSCGPRTYMLEPSYPFLTLAGDLLTLQSNDPAEEGLYDVRLTVGFASWPLKSPLIKTFQVAVQCEILQMDLIKTIPSHMTHLLKVDQPQRNNYEVNYYPACKTTARLTPLADFIKINQSTKEISVQPTDVSQAGSYTFTFTIEPAYPNIGVSKSFDFRVDIVNLCAAAKFVPQSLKSLQIIKQNPDFLLPHTIPFEQANYSPLRDYSIDCGEISYSLVKRGADIPVPQWISLSGQQIKVQVNEALAPTQIDAALVLRLTAYKDVMASFPFTVTVIDLESTCRPGTPVTYKLGGPQVTIKPEIALPETFGQDGFTQFVEPIIKNVAGESTSIVTYVEDSRSFVFKGFDLSAVGSWEVGVHFGFQEFPQYAKRCVTMLTVLSDGAVFFGEQMTNRQVQSGQPIEIAIPLMTDQFGRVAQVNLDLGDASQFLEFDKASGVLRSKGDPEALAQFEGLHEIWMVLSDSMNRQKKVVFFIRIDGKAESEVIQDEPQVIPTDQAKQPPPVPFIQKVTNDGFVRVAFSRALQLPTFAKNPEFKQEAFWRRSCTNGGQGCLDQSRRILRTAQEQSREQEEALQIVNRGIIWANNTEQPVVQLEVVPGILSNNTMLNFTWNCTKVTPWYMDFEVDYQYKDEISFHEFQEAIKVTFVGKRYFPAADDGQMIPSEDVVVSRLVPQQMEKDQARALGGTATALEVIGKLVLLGLLAQWFVVGCNPRRLYAAFRKLQIMVHLVITAVMVPANAMIFFSGIWHLVCYQIVDLTPLLSRWFGLVDREAFNQHQSGLGYPSVYFLLNINNLWLIVAFQVLALIYLEIAKRFTMHRRVNDFTEKLRPFMIWSAVLSFIDNTLIIFAVSVFTQFKHWDWQASKLSCMLSLVFGFAIAISLVVNLMVMLRLEDNFLLEGVRHRFSYIYEELNYQRLGAKGFLLTPFWSQLRVVLLAANLILLEGYPIFQIQFTNALFLITVIHIEWSKVYRQEENRVWQLVNEVFICLINYHVILFTQMVGSKAAHTGLGWSAVATLTLALVLNLGYLIYFQIQQAITMYKQKLVRQQREKEQREARDRAMKRQGRKATQLIIRGVQSVYPVVQNRAKPQQMSTIMSEDESVEDTDLGRTEQNLKTPGKFDDDDLIDEFEVEYRLKRASTLIKKVEEPNLIEGVKHGIQADISQLDVPYPEEELNEIDQSLPGDEKFELSYQSDNSYREPKESAKAELMKQEATIDMSTNRNAIPTTSVSPTYYGFVKRKTQQEPSFAKPRLAYDSQDQVTSQSFVIDLDSLASPHKSARLVDEQPQNAYRPFYADSRHIMGATMGPAARARKASMAQVAFPETEYDDQLAHSGRVEKNRRQLSTHFSSAERAKIMFDELWRNSRQK